LQNNAKCFLLPKLAPENALPLWATDSLAINILPGHCIADGCPSQPSTYYLIGLLWDGMIILGNPATSDIAINVAVPECAHHWAQ
jgi:hypothetical protein